MTMGLWKENEDIHEVILYINFTNWQHATIWVYWHLCLVFKIALVCKPWEYIWLVFNQNSYQLIERIIVLRQELFTFRSTQILPCKELFK